MIFSLVTIAIVLAVAYIWGSRGFFSSLIHLVCVIVAGAVAFALWEPITQMIIQSGGTKSNWMPDIAFGVALAVPFAVTLAVLRLATNGIIRSNVDLDGVTNMVGGALCGVGAGIITAGIMVLSVSNIRLQTFMGYEPIVTGNNGSLSHVQGQSLWFPVERLTGRFYSAMSNSTFSVENSLAKWHPDVADEGALLRINFDDGKSKAFISPDAFEVLGTYVLDPKDPKEVLNDTIEPTKKRQYSYLDDSPATPGQTVILGAAVRFKPEGNEKSGRVIVGNSQMRLVVQKSDGESMGIQPIAVISEADNPKSVYSRWVFEGQKSFIATFNGRNDATMSFEFPMPKGSTPLALYVKGQRVRLDDNKVGKFASYDGIVKRDAAIADRSIAPRSKATPIDASAAVKSNPTKWSGDPPMRANEAMPYNVVLQKDDSGGLEVEGSGRSNSIVSGEAKFKNDRLRSVTGSDPALQVRKFSPSDDVTLVQVVVDGNNAEFGFLSAPAGNIDRGSPPLLVDDSGQQYSCYGYVYKSPTETWIRYTPEAPITSVAEMPAITRSQPNDRLTLLFRVGKTAKIKYFAVGGTAIVEFDKPFAVTGR